MSNVSAAGALSAISAVSALGSVSAVGYISAVSALSDISAVGSVRALQVFTRISYQLLSTNQILPYYLIIRSEENESIKIFQLNPVNSQSIRSVLDYILLHTIHNDWKQPYLLAVFPQL